MVKFTTLLWITLLLGGCSANTEPKLDKPTDDAKQALPALHIQPEVYALGDIQEGEAAIVVFLIRNNGAQAVELVDIQVSCGCTAATPDSYIIPAGGFTQLKVSVDTTAKQEGIKKSVFVTDSLGHQASAILTFNVVENPHPKQGDIQGIFDGLCASCHFEPLVDIAEPAKLYAVGCAMCHGDAGQGAYAPQLLGFSSQEALVTLIGEGVGKPQMPGFAQSQGGPLSDKQIESLAHWIMTLPKISK